MWLLSIIAIIVSLYQIFKEKRTPKIPRDNWGTGKTYGQDILNGVPHEERMRRLETGYYKDR